MLKFCEIWNINSPQVFLSKSSRKYGLESKKLKIKTLHFVDTSGHSENLEEL